MRVTYSSNNSGGVWWLNDKNWEALEKAGWVVEWLEPRFLRARATEAHREGLSYEDAIAEWEQVTGLCAEDEGCVCCGRPHYFYTEND